MSILTKITLLVATALAFLSPVSSTVADCGKGKSKFEIQTQGFSPEPPIANQNATLWISYTIPPNININAGSCKYSVNLNGIPIPSTTDDLCTQVKCPLVSGDYNLSSSSVWPPGVSGKVITKIEWYDVDKNLLLCSQTTEKV